MNTDKNKKSKEYQDTAQPAIVKNKLLRWLLIASGSLFVGLGVIGIFLPVLPTTPFLLLAAWCYARSSERYYNWLINNKTFGKYIKDYREGKGIPVRAKITAIALLWLTISLSIIFIVFNLYIRIIMLITAVVVSIYIASIKPKPTLAASSTVAQIPNQQQIPENQKMPQLPPSLVEKTNIK